MVLALLGILEAHLQDALNLRTGVDIGIVGHVVVLVFLTEIHTTRELADNDEVGSTNEFVLQRTLMQKAGEGGHGPYVGKEPELLAHGEKSLLRSDRRGGIVVVAQVAHGSKEHRIGSHAHIVSGIGIRVANEVDGMCTTDGFFVFEFMMESLCNGIEDSNSLRHDLRSDAITRQYSDFQLHSSFIKLVMSIYDCIEFLHLSALALMRGKNGV